MGKNKELLFSQARSLKRDELNIELHRIHQSLFFTDKMVDMFCNYP